MSNLIDQNIKNFKAYLLDPDNIKQKPLRVFFEKQIIKINKAIGTKFFGLFSRKVDLNEMVSYFSCLVLLAKLCSILEDQSFFVTEDPSNHNPATKSLYKVYSKGDLIVVISNSKVDNQYSLNVYFYKNFDTKGYGAWSKKELVNNYKSFVLKQNLTNPLIYDPKITEISEVFIKEFERRMKVYTWVELRHLLKETGVSRFMRTFND